MAADNLAQQAEGEAAPALIDKLEVLARRYTAARGDFLLRAGRSAD